MNTPNAFQKLLGEFAELLGASTEQLTTALEFESEGRTVKVLAHPASEHDFIVEVEVGVLADPLPGAASMAFMDLPGSSAGCDKWHLLLLDGERMILKKTIPVHGTTAHDLEGVMSEALDKAEELRSGGSLKAPEEFLAAFANPLHFA
jgi:hypothetical protein